MLLRTYSGLVARAPERGANLVEYALLIAFIVLVVVSAVEYFGQATVGHFDDLNAEWENFGSDPGPAP